MQQESFPRQSARTRGFTNGSPRQFRVSPDGTRVVFVRSTSGQDWVGRLWVQDAATGAERLVADPVALHSGAEDLSEEELARRERMREGGAGIVGYATDRDVTLAAFALSGGLYAVGLDGGGAVRALDVPGPVMDPRPSPDGRHIAYVSGRSLRVVGADGSDDRELVAAPHDLATAGLVDFIAAEELDRTRGFWWSPRSDALLVELVDVTPVQEWWIADPAHPERRPRPHRYPAAGTANEAVSLLLVTLDGRRTVEVPWDHAAFPYLVDVTWNEHGDPLLVVMTRDQRTQRVLAVDVPSGATRTITDLHDDAWVDAAPAATTWSPDGRLLTLRADRDSDTYRLHLDDAWLSPPGLQVRAVSDVSDGGVLVTTAPDPIRAAVVLVGWDGSTTAIGPDDAWVQAVVGGGTQVLVSRRMSSSRAVVEVRTAGGSHPVVSHAEAPSSTPRVTLIEAGERALRTAVMFPSTHIPGSRRLPVLLSPYGGPHHQEVSGLRPHGEAQWLADQGFVVVVTDGRGTPGRGPAFERAVHHDVATPVLEDQVAALDAVIEHWPDDVDPARVGIRGWSFGGYLAALAVLRRPDRFHAAVAGAPVTDWRLYDSAYTERYLGDPTQDPEPYDRCSIVADAPNLRRPLMLMHGLTDDNVVVAHTLRLSGALTAAGRPHQVVLLSGVTHMTPQVEVAENKLLLELDFLTTALRA